MTQTVDGYQQLVDEICRQQPGIKELQFSMEPWPPALEIPPEGIELGDLNEFVKNVFEDCLGSVGIGAFLDPFFQQLPTLEGVCLTRFEVDLDDSSSDTAFFVGFQLRESWNIISDSGLPSTPALVLSDPGFTIGSSGRDAGYMVDVYGTLEIFGLALQVMVQWPAMIITGTLVRELDLQDMLAKAGFEGHVTFGDETEGLEIRALMLRMDLSNKAFDFTFGMGGWEILPDKLALNNLLLDLSIRAEYNSASVRAQVALCDIDIDLSGAFQDGQLEFSGSTGPGQKLPIGRLIVELDDLFGTGTGDVPTAISSLTFEDLSLAFNTGDASHFAFKGKSSLQVDGSPVKISVDIDVTGSKKEIGAQLTIGGEQFTVSFDDQKVSAGGDQGQYYSTALIALYEHDSTQGAPAPDLRYMVEPLSSDLAEIVPPIQITKAIFGYHTEKKKEGVPASAWLFGVELGAMDFSIRDQSLPLVSALIGSDLSFGVESPQLLLTTQALNSEVLQGLPSLGDKFKLPQDDLNQACLSANLNLASEKYPLMVNLGEGQEKETAPKALTAPESRKAIAADSPPVPAAEAPTVQETAAAAPPAGDVTWIKVQKQVGVLYFEKIGVRYKDGSLGLLLGASLTAAGLTISLDGFSIDSPLDEFRPTFDLSGLGIRYTADPVEVSGAFLKIVQNGSVQYSGQALIKAESFMLAAIGSYASVEGQPSLFIFAYLDMPLGGPPCFFVTGLAAGFGYNRSLRTPAIEQVEDFPLVATMAHPEKIGGKDASPMDVLASLGDWVRPQPGAFWLAAGISFQSFKIIDSKVLAIVEFGRKFQVVVVGLSTLELPQKAKARTYVKAKLMIQVIVKPAEGVVSAGALLTSDSYVLHEDCHLTGGFAFFVWFGANDHAGDFVLTLGGYHPAYTVPDHYPLVPRLGINWAVSNTVSIKGEAYFALTPSNVMTGGRLEVLYQSGSLRAWFIADANVYVAWEPFYFDARIGVRVGASYRIDTWLIHETIQAELGATLELWGPPTGGRAHISWSIISFTVGFGAGKQAGDRYVDWNGFKTMLPQRNNGDRADPDLAVIQINVNNGLTQQVDGENGKKRWIVRADEFAFSIETAVPLTRASLTNGDRDFTAPGDIGIRPMGIASMVSEQTITITPETDKSGGDKSAGDKPLNWSGWSYEELTRKMPDAMWSNSKVEPLHHCLVGVKNIGPGPGADPSGPPQFEMEEALDHLPVSLKGLPLSVAQEELAVGMPPRIDPADIQKTLVDSAIRNKRAAVFEALAGMGANAGTNGDLRQLAANPAASLKAAPMVGSPVPGVEEALQ
jgi:hypothetical protein